MESLPRQVKGNSSTVGHLHATSEHENDSFFILEACGGGLSAYKSGKTAQQPRHFQTQLQCVQCDVLLVLLSSL